MDLKDFEDLGWVLREHEDGDQTRSQGASNLLAADSAFRKMLVRRFC